MAQKNQDRLKVPKEVQEQANDLIRDAFRCFSGHNQRMKEARQEFNHMDQEVKERLQRGIRRTSGRIV